jgi:hypothetical protein
LSPFAGPPSTFSAQIFSCVLCLLNTILTAPLRRVTMISQGDPRSKMDQVLGLERDILRAMCASSYLTAERGRLLEELASHTWLGADHRVVYEALQRTVTRDPGALRSELPATTTRMGFPDVDWSEFFDRGGALQIPELESRIRTLKAASSQSPSQT